jgi:hypothetical protein
MPAGFAGALPGCSPAVATAPTMPDVRTPGAEGEAGPTVLERLQDPDEVSTAVLDLVKEYQTLRNDGEDLEPWLAEYLEPLTTVYADQLRTLRPEARRSLIQLLAGTADPRTEPALRAALEAFPRGELNQADVDLESAARAQEQLRLATLQAPLFAAFQALHAHTTGGQRAYQSVSRGLLGAPDAAWAPTLRNLVSVPMPLPSEDAAAHADQLFWQTVAAQLLGVIGDEAAAKPLLRLVLDPAKSEIGPTAVLALVKLGPATVASTSAVLRGEDQESVRFHRAQMERVARQDAESSAGQRRDDHVVLAAVVLGAAGHAGATASFQHALRRVNTSVDRAVLLRELAKLPTTEQGRVTFQREFARLGLEVRMPPNGVIALAELAAEAVPRFYDPSLVPWLLNRADNAFGDPVSRSDFRRASLATAIKLAQLEQLSLIEPKIAKWGTPLDSADAADPDAPRLELQLSHQARSLLERCQGDEACYVEALVDPGSQSPLTRFTAVRAAYQLGIIGTTETAARMAEQLPQIDSAAIRFAVVQAIDHLLPDGSSSVADHLEAVAHPSEQGDPIREVAYRLRGRARASE